MANLKISEAAIDKLHSMAAVSDAKVQNKIMESTIGAFTYEVDCPDDEVQFDIEKDAFVTKGERLEYLYGLSVSDLSHLVKKHRGKATISSTEVWWHRESELALVGKLSLMGLNVPQIHQRTKIPLSRVSEYKKEMSRRAPLQLRAMDFQHFASDLLYSYRNIYEQGQMLASADEATIKDKALALSLSLKAKREMLDFLDRCKVFETANPMGVKLGVQSEDDDGSGEVAAVAQYLKEAIPSLQHIQEGEVVDSEATPIEGDEVEI